MTPRMRLMNRLMVTAAGCSIIIYLQIDGSVSADALLMVMHIRDTESPKANRALSISKLNSAKRSQPLLIFIGLGSAWN